MRPARLLLLLFITAQFWDGVFTWVAVDAHGIGAEGNVVLATWMTLAGPAPTLLTAKIGAAAGGVLLYLRGIHGALLGLTLAYAIFAIGPWLAHYSVL